MIIPAEKQYSVFAYDSAPVKIYIDKIVYHIAADLIGLLLCKPDFLCQLVSKSDNTDALSENRNAASDAGLKSQSVKGMRG